MCFCATILDYQPLIATTTSAPTLANTLMATSPLHYLQCRKAGIGSKLVELVVERMRDLQCDEVRPTGWKAARNERTLGKKKSRETLSTALVPFMNETPPFGSAAW